MSVGGKRKRSYIYNPLLDLTNSQQLIKASWSEVRETALIAALIAPVPEKKILVKKKLIFYLTSTDLNSSYFYDSGMKQGTMKSLSEVII